MSRHSLTPTSSDAAPEIESGAWRSTEWEFKHSVPEGYSSAGHAGKGRAHAEHSDEAPEPETEPTEPAAPAKPAPRRAANTSDSAKSTSDTASSVPLKSFLYSNPHDGNFRSPFPRWVQKLGIALFLLLIVIAGLCVTMERWRRGSFGLGVAMVWLALLRTTCDSSLLGVLSVRSRKFDVAFCFAVGVAILYLAISMDSYS